MTTKRDKTQHSMHSVDRGLELGSVPEDFVLQPCTLEDLDRAVFKLFNEDLPFYFKRGSEQVKVPIIFSTGERFSFLNRKSPLRDEAGALILPLISVNRNEVSQTSSKLANGQTEPLKIVRRLTPEDPAYQALVNKQGLRNQDNVASPDTRNARPGALSTRRKLFSQSGARITLAPSVDSDNMYEIITTAPVKFYTVTYAVSMWCNYMQQVNDLMAVVMSSYHNQHGRQFRVESPKGYWFTVTVQDSFSQASNFDSFSVDERVVKYDFNLTGEGYIINPEAPGQGSAVRSFISAPQVSFESCEYTGDTDGLQRVGAPTGDPDDLTLQDFQTDVDPLHGQAIAGLPAIAPLDARGDLQRPESRVGNTTSVGGTSAGSSSDVVLFNDFEGRKTKARVTSRDRRKGETVIRVLEEFD